MCYMYWVTSMEQNRQDIEKCFVCFLPHKEGQKWSVCGLVFKIEKCCCFFCPLKRVKNAVWYLKFSCVSFPKFAILPNFQKIYIFSWSLAFAILLLHSDLFIFDNVICIPLKVPSIKMFLSIGDLNGKNCPKEVSEHKPIFFSIIFLFVNLQINQ